MILQAQFVRVSSCWPYEAECFHFGDVSCTSHMSTRAGKKDCHLTQCTNHLLTSTPHQFNTVRFFGGQNAKLHDPTVSSCFGIITKAIVPLWLFGNFSWIPALGMGTIALGTKLSKMARRLESIVLAWHRLWSWSLLMGSSFHVVYG